MLINSKGDSQNNGLVMGIDQLDGTQGTIR